MPSLSHCLSIPPSPTYILFAIAPAEALYAYIGIYLSSERDPNDGCPAFACAVLPSHVVLSNSSRTTCVVHSRLHYRIPIAHLVSQRASNERLSNRPFGTPSQNTCRTSRETERWLKLLLHTWLDRIGTRSKMSNCRANYLHYSQLSSKIFELGNNSTFWLIDHEIH